MRGLLPLYRGLHTLSNRQARRKAGIVGSRCGFCGTESNSKPQPSFGLLFDIDGVLVRGRMPIPAAKKAFEKLVDSQGQFVVPVVFVTNAGNCLRQKKADQLSHILGVPITQDQVIMSHSPLRMFKKFHDKCVLVSGQGPVLEIAKKFGHGTFLVCLENIYKKITGKDLKYEALIGKPSELTYHFAEYLIRSQAMQWQWKLPITSLYAIGDNLMTDIYGANLYNRYLEERVARKNPKAVAKMVATTGSTAAVPQEEEIDNLRESELALPSATSCKSVLVCTGVYNPKAEVPSDASHCIKETVFHGHRDFIFDPALVEPGHIVQDVAEAVDLIFEQEKFVPQ
eukprot:superscaffoldBa00001293_g9957